MIVQCPRCGKQAEMTGNPFRPFCSERCKTIDLGNWISGAFRIPEDQPEDGADDESRSRKDLKKE